MPEISVVIPTLDRWGMVSRAVDAVLTQEDVDLELIVVDDGSSDGTPAGLAAVADARLRVIRHDRTLGAARARNDGLAAAAGEWTAFLDDDDLWAPRKLREQLAAAAAVGAGVALAYSAAIVLDAAHTPLGLDPAPPTEGLHEDLLGHNSIPGGCSNAIVRTAVARRLGGFDEQLSILADWDLWIRLAAAGPAAACNEPHVAYVEHGESMHVEQAGVAARDFARVSARHRHSGVDRRAGMWLLLWVAAGQHRAGHRLLAAGSYFHGAVRHRSKGALLRALAAPFSERLVRQDLEAPLRPLAEAPAWLDTRPQAAGRRATGARLRQR